jgi:sec-independent protein translocase protein TatA
LPNIGGTELLVIGLIVLLLFGGSKIPALMRGLGQGIREFRKEVRGPDETRESPSDKPAPKEGP